MTTGWPAEKFLLQDLCRGLSLWLAERSIFDYGTTAGVRPQTGDQDRAARVAGAGKGDAFNERGLDVHD